MTGVQTCALPIWTQFLAGPFGSERPAWRSADGVHWTALTPEEQDTAPAIQRGRSPLNGLTFTLRGGRELWVTDGQGRAWSWPDAKPL